ncbi:MAG: DUF2267 domain-containing protein, partial [Pseudomonadota bacterium]
GKDWDVTAPPVPFLSRDELHLLREVKRVRVNHNPTPGNAIETNAWAVRRSCNARDLQRVFKRLPEGAVSFWHINLDDPGQLEKRMI